MISTILSSASSSCVRAETIASSSRLRRLQTLHAQAVGQAGQRHDQRDVRDQRPPAQPPRRQHGELVELRQRPDAVAVARHHREAVRLREEIRRQVGVADLRVRLRRRPAAVVAEEPRAIDDARFVAERQRRVGDRDLVVAAAVFVKGDVAEADDRRLRIRLAQRRIENRQAARRGEVNAAVVADAERVVRPRFVVDQAVRFRDARADVEVAQIDFGQSGVLADPDRLAAAATSISPATMLPPRAESGSVATVRSGFVSRMARPSAVPLHSLPPAHKQRANGIGARAGGVRPRRREEFRPRRPAARRRIERRDAAKKAAVGRACPDVAVDRRPQPRSRPPAAVRRACRTRTTARRPGS